MMKIVQTKFLDAWGCLVWRVIVTGGGNTWIPIVESWRLFRQIERTTTIDYRAVFVFLHLTLSQSYPIYRIPPTQSFSSFFSTSVTMKTGLWLRMKMYFVTINRYILQFGQIYFWLRSMRKMAIDKLWEDDKVEQLRQYKLKRQV